MINSGIPWINSMCLYLNIQLCNVFSYHFQNYKWNGVQFNGIEMSNFYLKNYSNAIYEYAIK